LLGFDRVQRNPVNVQNSRGRAELKALRWCSDIGLLLEKLSWDLILYSTAEFNFFTLPESITTGSSIMPQKHNPDVLELIRARVARIRGSASELEWVIGKLPSNYHRDFQYTKSPVFRGVKDTLESIRLIELAVRSFSINEQVLNNSRTPELYATYAAFRKVKEGKAFRDAYKETAEELKAGKIIPEDYADDLNVIIKENEKELSEAKVELARLSKKVTAKKEKFEKVRAAAFEKKFSWTKKLFG
jgi:argininosuccinate lyase